MKNIIKLFLITLIFFISLFAAVNTVNTGVTGFSNLSGAIQTLDNRNSIYNAVSKFEKCIVPASRTENAVIFQKNSGPDISFGNFRNCLSPDNHQFVLLLSYIYNKSYLIASNNTQNWIFLTEISPHAP